MRYLIFIFIIAAGCSDTKPMRQGASTPNKQQTTIPAECLDAQGNYDPNLGSDTLDCDNLPR